MTDIESEPEFKPPFILGDRMRVTINPYVGTRLEVDQWPIHGEPPRFVVEYNNLSYSLVLDAEQPRLEVWNMERNSTNGRMEINEIIKQYDLVGGGINLREQ